MHYEHPIYTPESVAAQRRLPALNDGTVAFAGAYHGWGFHEDGCARRGARGRALGRAGDGYARASADAGPRHVALRRRGAPRRGARAAPRFRHRVYLWLVDLDALPRLPALAAAVRPVRARATTSATRAHDPAEPRRATSPPTGRPARRAGADARQRPRARVRVQPADRLLVPPARRRARVRRRRGPQHLRRAALLPAAHRRGGPGARPAKEFYVSPFLAVDGEYRMQLPVPGERLRPHDHVAAERVDGVRRHASPACARPATPRSLVAHGGPLRRS